MSRKGRAEFGPGAAKWRHGWIPVNAAARAIVAARSGRKTEESSSEFHVQSKNGVFRVVNRKDEVVFTTARKDQVDKYLTDHGQEIPKPRAKPTFKALDSSHFASITGPHDAEADAINTNPNWLDSRAKNEKAFTSNCALAVQAWELRRRGMATQAAPIPEYANGYEPGEIARNWKFPNGSTARFHFESDKTLSMASLFGQADPQGHREYIEKQTKNWPVGARGFIVNIWLGGGGHIYGVEKQADGLHYYDPQAGLDLGDGEQYYRHTLRNGILRIDDKTPTNAVEDLVDRSGRTEGSPSHPGRSILTAKPTPEGLAALDKKISQTEKDLFTVQQNGRTDDERIAANMLKAFQDARGKTPNQIMQMIKQNETDYFSGARRPEEYDVRKEALRRSMKLQHPGLKEFAKHQVALDQDQSEPVPSDLLSAAMGKVTGPPPGISRITGPHDMSADAAASNPHFDDGLPYQTNCVNAVVAYELRRRGFAVSANPEKSFQGSSTTRMSTSWEDPKDPIGLRSWTFGSPSGAQNIARNWPDGARGWVLVSWKDGSGSHIFSVEKSSGKLTFVDPQSGKIGVDDYFNRVGGQVGVMRADDLQPGPSTFFDYVDSEKVAVPA